MALAGKCCLNYKVRSACLHILYSYIQGGPHKAKPTTILLVTFECVGKIQLFLADINCIQQEVQDHPNGIIHRFKSGLLGGHMSGLMKVTFWCCRYAMVFQAVWLCCIVVRKCVQRSSCRLRRSVGSPRHSCVRWGLRASSGRGEFWGRLPPLAEWFQCRVDRMWRYLACQVFIMTKFA